MGIPSLLHSVERGDVFMASFGEVEKTRRSDTTCSTVKKHKALVGSVCTVPESVPETNVHAFLYMLPL